MPAAAAAAARARCCSSCSAPFPLHAALLLLCWGAYLAWLLAPEGAPLLRALPPRLWGLLPPGALVCAVCTYGAVYGALALAVNPPLDARGALCDGHARRPALLAASGAGASAPALGDLPVTLVNRAQLAAVLAQRREARVAAAGARE